ncbi:MAG: hypothetical protein ACE5G0_20940 [Rhodothermales bacterium]
MRLLLTSCVALFLFVGATPPDARAQTDDVEAFIERLMEAYGGREALAGVQGYRLEASMHAYLHNEDADVVRDVDLGERLEVVIQYPDVAEVRVLEGEAGWRGRSGEDLEPVEEPLLGAMVLQATRANMPWVLDQMKDRARLFFLEGHKVQMGVEVQVKEGLIFRAYVDPETFLIVQAQSVVQAGAMQIEFETKYSDFREVEGLFFPFHEENYASGSHTATTTVQQVMLKPKAE